MKMRKLKLINFISSGGMMLAVLLVFAGALAQEKKKEKPKPKPVPVYLGRSNINEGKIPVHVFDSLLKQGLTARDSAGRSYTVNGFLFTYGERNLYEDSVGNLMMLTDLLVQPCDGDSMNAHILDIVKERSKAGDTVYFDDIIVVAPEGYNANGKSMRVILTR